MNMLIVVEGEVGEKAVYCHWVPLVNPKLSVVDYLDEVQECHFVIVAGGGYPNLLEVIEAAIQDANSYGNIDRLVIAVDSEESSFQEKYEEISLHVSRYKCSAEIRIIVQHFCLEAWALGNRVMIRKNPKGRTLRKYNRFFDVRVNDPELLTPFPPEELRRVQFAEKYLRRALNDRNRNLTYTKGNPTALLHDKYFFQLRTRLEETGHIGSFRHFLEAFE